jgi:hypothetical protein
MKTTVLVAALAALIAPVQAGNGHHGGGGGGYAGAGGGGPRGGGGASFRSMPAGHFGGGASFRSMPMRNFSGNRMVYSGQRFSSAGVRSPGMTEFRSRPLNSNMALGRRQFTGGNAGNVQTNQFRNGRQFVRNGNSFARNNNNVIRNRTGGQFGNGNRLAPNWRNHVVAQHSGNWHRDWDHHHDHFFHGNRFVFIDGFWWGFGLGFNPWWWDYPYYGYGYDYPYNYGYGYNYGNGYDNGYSDQGVYDSQPAYQAGYDDQSGNQNGYNDQSANSTIAGAQDRLTRDGYYSGQIDGVMGPETRHAIVRFQTKHGLRISGELTTETLDAMGLRQSINYGSN